MPRQPRNAKNGTTYHCFNRGLERRRLFDGEQELLLAEHLLLQAKAAHDVSLHAFTLTPHHWHVIVTPHANDALSRFIGAFSRAHASILRRARDSVGDGYVYRGRFRSYPLRTGEEILRAVRFVERDAVELELVARAEHWPHTSAHHRLFRTDAAAELSQRLLLPGDWLRRVNEPLPMAEVAEIMKSLQSGRPLGEGRRYMRRARRFARPVDDRFLA